MLWGDFFPYLWSETYEYQSDTINVKWAEIKQFKVLFHEVLAWNCESEKIILCPNCSKYKSSYEIETINDIFKNLVFCKLLFLIIWILMVRWNIFTNSKIWNKCSRFLMIWAFFNSYFYRKKRFLNWQNSFFTMSLLPCC